VHWYSFPDSFCLIFHECGVVLCTSLICVSELGHVITQVLCLNLFMVESESAEA
jgi:hypothetical protein